MKDHHNNHQNSISDGEDVEWRPPHILGLDVKLQVALENHYSEHELGGNRQSSPEAGTRDDDDAGTGQ